MMFGVQYGNLSQTAARNFPNWGFFFGGRIGGRAEVGGGGLYALARFWFSVIISRMKNVLFRRGISAVCAGILCASSAPAWGKSAKEVFAEVARSVVVVLALDSNGETSAQGSGVVVGKNEVATNCHVIEDAAKVVVRQALESDIGQSYRMDSAILARDDERDLCLLFVGELSEPPAAPIVKMGAAKALSIGEEIFAIGAPKGLDLSLSRGIVSQLRRLGDRQTAPFVQTDAAISPGSSGGGLFNENAELVGITTFKRVGGENLNFAIPAEWVGDLREHGRKELAAQEKVRECPDNPDYECVIAAALFAARSVDSANSRVLALSAIAVAQVEAGNKQDAQDTLAAALSAAQNVDPRYSRIWALSAIAKVQAEAGNKQGAQDTFAAALSAARRINATYYRAVALSAIAEAQAEAGNKQGAQDTFAAALSAARSIDSESYRAETLSAIAKAQAEVENITARNIDNASDRTGDLGDILEAQMEAGNFRGAMKTAMKIEEDDARVKALAGIAKHLAARERN